MVFFCGCWREKRQAPKSLVWRSRSGGSNGGGVWATFWGRIRCRWLCPCGVPAAGGVPWGPPHLVSPTTSHSPRPPKFPPRLKLSFPPNPPPRPPPKFPEPLRPKRGGGGGQPLGTAQAAGSSGSWGGVWGLGGRGASSPLWLAEALAISCLDRAFRTSQLWPFTVWYFWTEKGKIGGRDVKFGGRDVKFWRKKGEG